MGRLGARGHAIVRKQRTVAIVFVMMLGLVSLLADVAIEGTKSVMGSYLAILGASAAVVGIVSGLAELVGFSLRIVFGWLMDETGKYWTFVFIGYGINIVAVPALALAGNWEAAVCLMMLERVGRAVRSPARDAMLSHAGKTVGRGWSYGVQEALSSVGGMIGPIIVVVVMLLGGDYRLGFEILLLPCVLAVVVLFQARKIDPHPGDIKGHCPVKEKKRKFSKTYWIFLMAGALIAAGYADFPMISYHISTVTTVSQGWIPILYALSMASSALAALVFGRMYDKIGIMPLVAMAAVIPFFAPLVFTSDMAAVTAGMLLYGVGFGAQDSAMRAMVADISPHCRRGMAFGCYNTAFGLSWFLGSAAMGVLYDVSLPSMIMMSMVLQFAAIPLFLLVMREEMRTKHLLTHGGTRPEPAPEPAPMPVLAAEPEIAPEAPAAPSAADGAMATSLPETPPAVSPAMDGEASSEVPAPEAPASPQ